MIIEIDPTGLASGDVVVQVNDHDISGCHCDVRVTVSREAESGESSDRSEQVPVTRIGGSFGVDLTAVRHAIANGATTLTFTAPEGWHFEDDRRLHPDDQ